MSSSTCINRNSSSILGNICNNCRQVGRDSSISCICKRSGNNCGNKSSNRRICSNSNALTVVVAVVAVVIIVVIMILVVVLE